MDTQGTVVVRLSTSSARIPLQGATVTITKRFPGGEVQLLAVRVQELSLIPTPELPSSFDRTETFVVPPQNLS